MFYLATLNKLGLPLAFCLVLTCGVYLNSEPYRVQVQQGNFFALPLLLLTYTPSNLLLISILTTLVAAKLQPTSQEPISFGLALFLSIIGLGTLLNPQELFLATQASYAKFCSIVVYAGLGPELITIFKKRYGN